MFADKNELNSALKSHINSEDEIKNLLEFTSSSIEKK